MPDLQTEIFTKVLPSLNNLKFDDADGPVLQEQHTAVVEEPLALTRQVFAFVNTTTELCTGKVVLDRFVSLGYKRSVVAATVQALINNKRLVRKGGKLSTTRDEYDKPKVAKETPLSKQVVQNKISEREREVGLKKEVFDIDIFMGTLSMYQGRELYLRLKAIYGG